MTDESVPPFDMTCELELLGARYQQATQQVLQSGRYIMGPNVQALEAEVAQYLGVAHAIGVNSGTDALVLALQAMGVGPGDEVITTSFTFIATADAVSRLGAMPVFVDIDPETFNIDPARVDAAITPRTKAILPVHLFGLAADMESLLPLARDRGLMLLEDVAQAFGAESNGAKLGSLGVAGTLSFFPTKCLGGFGDGGMIACNSDELASHIRMLRAHGARKKYHNEIIGYNSRLDELQAALLRVKFPYLEDWNERRRHVAARYQQALGDDDRLRLPLASDPHSHVFHQYTVRVLGMDRDRFIARLREAGAQSMVYYPVPLHQLPVYAGNPQDLPHSQRAAAEVVSLPMWPLMPEETQDRVIDCVREALEHH